MDPAGETGGVPDWFPGGFTIVMLRVTLIAAASSDGVASGSPYAFILPPPSDSLPEFDRELKVLNFRSFPRPLSGRGPATVSSQSWSSSPMGAQARAKLAHVNRSAAELAGT